MRKYINPRKLVWDRCVNMGLIGSNLNCAYISFYTPYLHKNTYIVL